MCLPASRSVLQQNEDHSSRCVDRVADDACCSDEVTSFVEIGTVVVYIVGLMLSVCCTGNSQSIN